MSTISVIIIVVISSLISGYLSWGIVEKKKWTLIISAIIVGSIMAYLGTVNLYMHNQFNMIENLVGSYNNSLSKSQNLISNLDDDNQKLIKLAFTDELEKVNNILEKVNEQNEIIIPKGEILNIWTKLIENSQKQFYASNLVPTKEWKYVNTDEFGIKPQVNAIKRGVDVKRINFFDKDKTEHKEGINLVHKAHQKNKIPSAQKSLESVKNNFTFNSLIEELRTADVVLVDDQILLLTTVDNNYEMEFAVLSFDKTKIKAAKSFFNKVFEDFPKRE